jgi:hypothetical protein
MPKRQRTPGACLISLQYSVNSEARVHCRRDLPIKHSVPPLVPQKANKSRNQEPQGTITVDGNSSIHKQIHLWQVVLSWANPGQPLHTRLRPHQQSSALSSRTTLDERMCIYWGGLIWLYGNSPWNGQDQEFAAISVNMWFRSDHSSGCWTMSH